MNAEQIRKLEANRETDALIAEKVMGWESQYIEYGGSGGEYVWILPDGIRQHEPDVPSYSTDIAAAYQMEERIAELGLIDEYCKQLNKIANVHWDEGVRQPQRWQLIHATPEDRCKAALMAVEK